MMVRLSALLDLAPLRRSPRLPMTTRRAEPHKREEEKEEKRNESTAPDFNYTPSPWTKDL